ncbi:MAG: hypothetical protein LBT08_01665 [Synergistaceae bacterium]|jgi:tRNA nucleotidyltransferase (CCA-adding enzyme)|nr:hypothetical protein [Synergistaceae bacterium]
MRCESDFVRETEKAGGRAYIVGGWVRDRLRGAAPHDKDYVVTGLAEDAFTSAFPDSIKVGQSFPVYRIMVEGEWCDVAFARSEVKRGRGYRGFYVLASPLVTLEDDLERRDTTINSMAYAPDEGKLIDPFCGARDIEAGIIRATSEHFLDDPVRALRAARQAAQFGYSIEAGTLKMMGACHDELKEEPGERLAAELAKALICDEPSVFFRALNESGVLEAAYPHVSALVGRPPGDGLAFDLAMTVVDRAASMTGRAEVVFAALVCCLGEDNSELVPLREWNEAMTLPKRWLSSARLAAREQRKTDDTPPPEKIVDLLAKLRTHPIGLDGFSVVLMALGKNLPDYLRRSGDYLAAIDSVRASARPPDLVGPEIGQWLRAARAAAISELLRD